MVMQDSSKERYELDVNNYILNHSMAFILSDAMCLLQGREFETTEQNIRVTCLCPSFTNTKMVQSASERLEHNESAQKSREKLLMSTGIME